MANARKESVVGGSVVGGFNKTQTLYYQPHIQILNQTLAEYCSADGSAVIT